MRRLLPRRGRRGNPRPADPLEQMIAEGLLSIGTGSYGRPNIVVWRDDRGQPTGGRVSIGNYCSISQGVEIYTGGEHRTDWITTWPVRVLLDLEGKWDDGHPASRGDVAIGHDVWIGRGATIRSGVTIGNGAVIGTRSLVTKSVAPYSIVGGNPAAHIRYRFDQPTIDALERIRWWDWTEDRVRDAATLLCSTDLAAFIERYG